MHMGNGRVVEVVLADGHRYARLFCPEKLIPGPGQYLLASDGSDAPLPVPLFYTDSAPQGFTTLVPDSWTPGTVLQLRGPLGRGFTVPFSARKIGLVAVDAPPARLRGLIQPALRQDASVVLLCDGNVDDVPDELEVQPLSALEDILSWADYIAIDVDRENLRQLMERLQTQPAVMPAAEVLICTPIPCGGIAECGVCAVTTKSGWQLACKDGPVFDLKEI